ncbi:MAG: redoxin family protein [Gammaproteobacteria bacterium]
MRRLPATCLLTALLVAALLAGGPARGRDPGVAGVALPEFTQTSPEAWINSPPLTRGALAGRVLLIDFWAFECWNCYRSFPWLKWLEAHFADRDFSVVGIHSPEFERERNIAAVRAKVEQFGLEHPVMVDNDFAYWNAMGNRYWPAYYLVDKAGTVRHVFVGETHAGSAQARRIRHAIAALLAE